MSGRIKEIKAIVQPFMLEHVLDALASIEGLPGVTISQVLGWGTSRASGEAKRIREAGHAFAPKTKVEIVVRAEMAQRVVEAIMGAAHTGNPGDGKVFVTDLVDAAKIRTGLRGVAAI